nr:MAG TPA: head tail connector [Caudoviricetes sp.]
MKVSELTLNTIKQYLRIDGNDDDVLLQMLLDASVQYCTSYMGCNKKDLEKYDDVTIVILSLISDSYEVRQFTTSTITLNPFMQGVLDLHCGNFLGGETTPQKATTPSNVTAPTPTQPTTPSPTNANATSNEVKTYNIIWGTAIAGAPNGDRGYLTYNPYTGFGKIHLDMRVTGANPSNGSVLCTLPNDAPVPSRLLEVSIDANNNSVYIEPNSRSIKGWGVVGGNKRYILDIVGFFK